MVLGFQPRCLLFYERLLLLKRVLRCECCIPKFLLDRVFGEGLGSRHVRSFGFTRLVLNRSFVVHSSCL